MAPVAHRGDVGENLNRSGVEFLKIDVEVGLTFSSIALRAQESERRARTRRVARNAYDTVLKLMERVALTSADAQTLARNLLRLKIDLRMLGEDL